MPEQPTLQWIRKDEGIVLNGALSELSEKKFDEFWGNLWELKDKKKNYPREVRQMVLATFLRYEGRTSIAEYTALVRAT